MCFRKSIALTATAFMVAAGLASAGYAELAIELPGTAGVYTEDLVVGQVELPGVEGSPDAMLRVSGSIESGSVFYCYDPGVEHPYGTEMHVFLYLGVTEGLLWSIADLTVDPVEGQFTAEGDFRGASESFAPILGLAGAFGFEFYVGYDPRVGPSLCITQFPGTVTIETVEIFSAGAVPVEESSWGGVKSLFK